MNKMNGFADYKFTFFATQTTSMESTSHYKKYPIFVTCHYFILWSTDRCFKENFPQSWGINMPFDYFFIAFIFTTMHGNWLWFKVFLRLPRTHLCYYQEMNSGSSSALSRLTNRLNFLKERRVQLVNELEEANTSTSLPPRTNSIRH